MVLKKEITLQIKEILQKNPQGLSITDIVKEVNINRNTAGRYLYFNATARGVSWEKKIGSTP